MANPRNEIQQFLEKKYFQRAERMAIDAQDPQVDPEEIKADAFDDMEEIFGAMTEILGKYPYSRLLVRDLQMVWDDWSDTMETTSFPEDDDPELPESI